jgi:hypothetical protein
MEPEIAAWAPVAGLVGLGMIAAGVLLALAAVIAVLPRALRVRRRALSLRASAAALRGEVEAALRRLGAQRAETAALVAPWRRLLRLVRHPLVAAAADWYLRRRASA